MDWNSQTLSFLSQTFIDTLSPQPEPRRRAELNLSGAADNPNHALLVLRLIAEPFVDELTRQCASIHFKNHLKTRWISHSVTPIPDTQKHQIKQLIVPLMLSTTPKIQTHLSEALTVIGSHDFPNLWPGLLPDLRSRLETAINGDDFVAVNGILGIVNSLFKKFRYEFMSVPVKLDLKHCLDNFAAPLTSLVERISRKMSATAASGSGSGSAADLCKLIEAQRLCCRVFYSFNKVCVPEFFEDNADKWMIEFRNCLSVRYPVIEDSADGGVVLVDGLRAAVCDNLSLYVERGEECFDGYLGGFVEAVWRLVVAASGSSSRERFTVTGIKFLSIVSTSVNHGLFAGDGILERVIQSVVVPNVMLGGDDEELFEMNCMEFIRRDMEGSDVDTRRRIACELLKGIAGNYKGKVAEKVSEQIRDCLRLFAENPGANWKYKDCVIYLVISLATKTAGGSLVSTDLVDVDSFFRLVIVPELQGLDVNAFPMLKAGALKFLTKFRVMIPRPVVMAALGDVVRFVGSDVNVVHSYAASCIEKLLLVRDGAQARYTSSDIALILPVLMTNLFGALEKPESEENQYIMRCIMRVLQVSDISPDVASPCITGLTSVLNRVCENPKNPVFNHCLFEAVATLVRRACQNNPSHVPAFETCLFPSLQMILSKEVMEFYPYAFQLFAQLVDLNRPPVPSTYMQIFDILLLSPDLWNTSANVPALVRLLQSFLRQAPNELNGEGRLVKVLEIFNKLVSSPSKAEQGFHILNPVIENLGYDVIAEYMNHIWASLFNHLQNSRTPRLVRCLIIFMSLFLVKHGIQTLVESINSVQANIFHAILAQFWVPNLRTITGNIEVKLCAVASSKLLCESQSLLDPAAEELWGRLLDGIVTLLSLPEEERVEDEPQVPDIGEATGYQATFVRLHNAGRREEDPLKEIQDPKHYSLALLANLSAQFRGRFPPIIARYLSQANQDAILQLCNSYNLTIV